MTAATRTRRALAHRLAVNAVRRHRGILQPGSVPEREARLFACLEDAIERRLRREARAEVWLRWYDDRCREFDVRVADLERRIAEAEAKVRS